MVPDWVLYFFILENVLFYLVILKVVEIKENQPKEYWRYTPRYLTRWNAQDQIVETREHIEQEFAMIHFGSEADQLIEWLEKVDAAYFKVKQK